MTRTLKPTGPTRPADRLTTPDRARLREQQRIDCLDKRSLRNVGIAPRHVVRDVAKAKAACKPQMADTAMAKLQKATRIAPPKLPAGQIEEKSLLKQMILAPNGAPMGNRTPVFAVRGRRPNR